MVGLFAFWVQETTVYLAAFTFNSYHQTIAMQIRINILVVPWMRHLENDPLYYTM